MLQVIDLPLAQEGFYHFISSWVYRRGALTIVVDPGPPKTVPFLITQLKAWGVEQIDLLLLTHVHLDHAGGTGLLARHFPIGQVLCHGRGIAHMVEPQRLWQGSLQTLGELAQFQGEPIGVEPEVISEELQSSLSHLPLSTFDTPGHAAHHRSYLIDGVLFVGEALGVIVPEVPSYLRPASPPRFYPEAYLSSIDLLRKVECEQLCFGHFGMRSRKEQIFDRAWSQMQLWLSELAQFTVFGKPPVHDQLSEAELDDVLSHLLRVDDSLKPFVDLPKALQVRERSFLANSVRGVLGYLGLQRA